VVPVMAASSNAATTITGNPTVDIAITANTTSTGIVLVQGSQNLNQTLSVNVKANPVGWTLAVRDAMADTKPVGTEGYMTAWDGVSAWVTPTVKLLSTMYIQGSVQPGATQSPEVNLTATDQTLETGTAATPTAGTDFIMTTRQPVEFNDQHLVSPKVYRIVLAFTGTAL